MDELLTVKDVAKKLQCNANFVYELINAGILPYLQFKTKRVRKNALDDFMQKYEGWDISNPMEPKSLKNEVSN